MHGTCGMCMQIRTSIGLPQRAVERPATAATDAATHPSSPVVELLPLAATEASAGPPARGLGWAVRVCTATR
jgi:hypothetical protein